MALSSIGFNKERLVLLLSGPIAVGKSAVAKPLIDHHQFKNISSGSYLRGLASAQGLGASRTELQKLGDELDAKTDYAWLIDDVADAAITATSFHKWWLLDSVRKKRQVDHFRSRYGAAVRHIHFSAPEAILRARYEARIEAGKEYSGNTPYAVAAAHPNELAARSLVEIADITIDLHSNGVAQAVEAVLEHCEGDVRACGK